MFSLEKEIIVYKISFLLIHPFEPAFIHIFQSILGSVEQRMMLHEIYNDITERYDYYRMSTTDAWRNAIRHNLSVNECFIKVGKADSGRG